MYYDSLKFSFNTQAVSALVISLYGLGGRDIIEEVNRECTVDIKAVETIHDGVVRFQRAFPNFNNPTSFLAFDFSADLNGEIFVFRPSSRFD